MARPKQVITRDVEVRVRFTPLEKKAVALMAEKVGLSLSEYIRQAAFNREMKMRFTTEELNLYKQLHIFRNNFAAIANLVKSRTESTELLIAIIQLKEEMEAHLKKFQ
ncbi:hypothetical protein Q0590_34945 [Rhodocytophaga aerolata]|uniref:Mobilization protein n=1 Tax=Rhodocytophaga aerolata TaxID=455078 RepID=A0ABT8RJT1_9BACT|nr:hypothetical protein [Rhodocytophaga aerolata]MDO1451523.1 hypothetical protein [Rhodocytophaga aerolata]